MGMSLKNVEGRAEVSKVENGECWFIPRVSRLLFNSNAQALCQRGHAKAADTQV